MARYNPKEIETKWQEKWEQDGIYQASEDPTKPKKYILEYFPYPSGAAMHVGHVRNYTIGDVLARHARMAGYNVLHPMGWDAFGLPAENYAIKTGISPRQAIDENTTRFKQQLTQMGFSYDWSREIDSTDPNYYRWTQWFFLLLFKRGLAYQQESLQWWCPHDKTVLANEQVEAGRCWRCGNEVEKKLLKQWFFKITDYADRLSKDLDDVDWSDSIKNMQRNWIGRSQGAEIDFSIDGSEESLKVFTTRPDTLFGATFMVIAPEHPLLDSIVSNEQREAVTEYRKQAQAKSDVERQETNREKTGVFTGAYAINPINGTKVPVWTADYVLAGYGTGAIMAVPAHDERDNAFAKKFNLPIREVVAAHTTYDDGPSKPRDDVETLERTVVDAIVVNEKNEYLLMTEGDEVHFVGGGIEDGEDEITAVKREVAEESGYTDYASVTPVSATTSSFAYRIPKQKNQRVIGRAFEVRLASDTHVASEVEEGKHTIMWVHKDKVAELLTWKGHLLFWQQYISGNTCWHDEGLMINSGKYDGLMSADAREQIVKDLETKGSGKERTNYKMRDWLISRQRYWGAPIPIIHCPDHGAVAVPDDQLPVVLPDITSFEPSGDGRSPLANVPEFVHTTCPECGGPAERETDTMDGFACSSWYFLRFADPHNNDKPFDADKVKFWLPVDDYIGGAEHAVMHLLYARMWTKVMHDAGLIDFDEPFKTLRNHGMILAPDGQKMSKSKGNTIEPGVLIDQGYGADSIRIMELFIGPWNQAANWSVEGMGGAYRFLQRVWTLVQELSEKGGSDAVDQEAAKKLQIAIHKTIYKVSNDVEQMSFNTAIAAMMECVNKLYELKHKPLPFEAADSYWNLALRSLVKLLAPFAPHIAEELWQELRGSGSVHQADWPVYDPAYLVQDTVTVVVQINGKLRATVSVASDANQDDIVTAASTDEKIKPLLEGKEIRKTIYVPGKLVNFVV